MSVKAATGHDHERIANNLHKFVRRLGWPGAVRFAR
jgi:hypothetical protein